MTMMQQVQKLQIWPLANIVSQKQSYNLIVVRKFG